jgi:hypothetical protein
MSAALDFPELKTREVGLPVGKYTWEFNGEIDLCDNEIYGLRTLAAVPGGPDQYLHLTNYYFPGLTRDELMNTKICLRESGSCYRVDVWNIPEFWIELSSTLDGVKGRFPGPRKHDFVVARDDDTLVVRAFDIRSGEEEPSFFIRFQLYPK